VPTTYRLADPEQEFGRLTIDALDRICQALSIQPGELLLWEPGKGSRALRKN
jgi:DNA-binding Xre family transcriptional regulator